MPGIKIHSDFLSAQPIRATSRRRRWSLPGHPNPPRPRRGTIHPFVMRTSGYL